ncbi:MAG TPA: PKD domain-containing protein, partial [Candidatus Binatia bacterium]|nr:PKD domain-containing protein [Candidatus Binatia bacterium]
VTNSDLPPQARCNGPYSGTVDVPLPFTSNGSGDPDGDSLSFHWTFGDGGFGEGPEPKHAYARSGPYPVTLIVSDGILAAGDQTLARISEADSARAFDARVAPAQGQPIELEAGGGRYCVAMEIVDAPASIADIDRFSVRLRMKGLGNTSAISADPTTFLLGDANGNGIPDATACFTQEDLRRLFGNVRGRLRVSTTIEFSLTNGHGFTATLPVDVIGPDGQLRALMAPNPLRPAGMFSFVTTVVGEARLTLFDSHGRRVRTVLDEPSLPTGYHDVPIDARGESGKSLSSGVYFYRLETPEGTRTGRLAIIR